MQNVTVSSNYQVVLPRIICKSLDIHPGQKVQVFLYNNRIEMIPVKPIKEARGFLKGIDTTVTREKDRKNEIRQSTLYEPETYTIELTNTGWHIM